MTRISGDNDFVLSTLAFCTLKDEVCFCLLSNDIQCSYTVYVISVLNNKNLLIGVTYKKINLQ